MIEIAEAALLRATPATVEALQGLATSASGRHRRLRDRLLPADHLRQFPVHALKIAGDFTQEIDADSRRPLARPRRGGRRDGHVAGHRDRRRRDRDRRRRPTRCASPSAPTARATTSTGRWLPEDMRAVARTRGLARRGRRRGRGGRRDHPRPHPPSAKAGARRPGSRRRSNRRRAPPPRPRALVPVAYRQPGPVPPAQRPRRPRCPMTGPPELLARVAVLGLGQLLAALHAALDAVAHRGHRRVGAVLAARLLRGGPRRAPPSVAAIVAS